METVAMWTLIWFNTLFCLNFAFDFGHPHDYMLSLYFFSFPCLYHFIQPGVKIDRR